MTGLNVMKDKIIEVAAVLTSYDLEELGGFQFHRIIHCEQALLNGMSEWCTEHHGNASSISPVLELIPCSQV